MEEAPRLYQRHMITQLEYTMECLTKSKEESVTEFRVAAELNQNSSGSFCGKGFIHDRNMRLRSATEKLEQAYELHRHAILQIPTVYTRRYPALTYLPPTPIYRFPLHGFTHLVVKCFNPGLGQMIIRRKLRSQVRQIAQSLRTLDYQIPIVARVKQRLIHSMEQYKR